MYIINFKYTFRVISKAFSAPNIESGLTSTKRLARRRTALKIARLEL